MMQMVKGLEKAMQKDIQEIDWMTPETKKLALEKLTRSRKRSDIRKSGGITRAMKIVSGDAFGNRFAPTNSKANAN